MIGRILAPLAFAVSLGACASFDLIETEAPADARYAAARVDFNAMASTLSSYMQQPWCGGSVIVACADRSVAERGLNIARGIDGALDAVGAAIRAGEEQEAETQLEAALMSMTALRSILARHIQKEG